MSNDLLETLDALNNERPNMLMTKRKHFNEEISKIQNKREKIEWMRLNAEQDRVDKYKEIAVQQTKVYYKILEKFAKMLAARKDQSIVPTHSQEQSKGLSNVESENSNDQVVMGNEIDF